MSFIEAQDPNLFVTLTFNGDKSRAGARKLLGSWHARVDRAVLGPKWQSHPGRSHFVAILEKPEVNPHWHLAMRVKDANSFELHDAALAKWKDLVPKGTVECKPIYKKRGLAEYITKGHISIAKAEESFVLSSEFSTM